MKERELAEVREKIARIICCFAKINQSCGKCEFNTERSPFPDCFPDIREDTDQLLTTPITIEGECPECRGTGKRHDGTLIDSALYSKDCPDCNGTGKVSKTFTIMKLIEEKLK